MTEWEKKYREELREYFATRSPRARPAVVSTTDPTPLLTKWRDMGFERLNREYLVLAQTVDDLRATVTSGLFGVPGMNVSQLIEIFNYLDIAAPYAFPRYKALLVLRAAVLDCLRRVTATGSTVPLSPIQKWLCATTTSPTTTQEQMPLSIIDIDSALIAFPIPELGRAHVANRARQRAAHAAT